MRKKSALVLLLAVCCGCVLAVGACGNAGPVVGVREDSVEALVKEINSFTDALIGKTESAADPAAGLDEAQTALDAGRGALKERLAKVKAGREFRESEEARGKLLECEVDNTDRVSKLRTRHLERWMKDAAFKSKLDKLVANYQDIFK